MTSRIIVVTAVFAAALTVGLIASSSSPAGAQSPTTTQSAVFDAGTTSAWSGSETTGAAAYDTATVTGTTPTGNLTYTLFNGSTCTGTPISTQDVTLNADGTVPNSSNTAPLAGGAYSFEAVYDGDTNNDPSLPSCAPFTVNTAPSNITTTVFDAATNAAWTGAEATGSSAYDTSSLGGAVTGFIPTGTVTYDYFGTGSCAGPVVGTDTETLKADGSVPQSSTRGPLAAGTYYFNASYSGDGSYAPAGPSGCESFTVGVSTSSITTTVFDAATNAAWTGSESTGSSAYDTATIGHTIPGFIPTGTVTYDYFGSGTCSGPVAATNTVTLNADGTVPKSPTQGPLGAGTYYFDASYSGDGNYAPSGISGCESFALGLPATTIATMVFDAVTKTPWSGLEVTGATAYDTATIGSTIPGFTPTGTVTYDYFGNGTCSGPVVGTDTETLNPDGSVPRSQLTQGPLGAGKYYFDASYNGDGNYAGSTSSCEPFTVGTATPSVITAVFDATTNTAWSGSEVTGATAYDTAAVGGTVGGIPPTGSLTYHFFVGAGNCTGSDIAQTVTLTAGSARSQHTPAPLGAGNYSFDATYIGDGNYAGSTSSCEPFAVGKATPSITTTVFDAATNAPWSGSEFPNASAYDTATVVGATGVTPTGSVTYDYYGTTACTGSPVASDTETVNPDGTVPHSTTQGPLSVAVYHFDASYSGDGNYVPSGPSGCETFGFGRKSPSTPLVSNIPTNAQFGSSFLANVNTTGDGAKTVTSSTPAICTVANGLTVSFVGVGTCTLTAHVALGTVYFQGDGAAQPFVVGRAFSSAPSISNLPFNPIAEGGFTATVSTNGDGQRSVSSSTTGVCTVGGDGLTVTYVAPGSCTLTAQVSQGPTHLGASGSPQTFTLLPIPHGYWLVGSDGGIFTFGRSQFWGSTGNIHLQRPVVGITPTDSRNGYWLVASDGGIFSFGDAGFHGSIPGVGLHPAGSGAAPSLNAPIVAMVPSATGQGYFMVASDGGVFAFGDARFAGSCPGIGGCAGSAVAVVPDSTGNGYWLFTNSGNVYTFGDAPYYGADPGTGVAVTSAVATPDGHGYWMLFSNGAIAPFGDAPNLGSPLGYTNPANQATTIFPTANGGGYWIGSSRGDVFAYGDAPFLGSMAGTPLNGMIIAASGY
jgi:hypothetical protein